MRPDRRSLKKGGIEPRRIAERIGGQCVGQGAGLRGTEHLFWGGDIAVGEGPLYTVDWLVAAWCVGKGAGLPPAAHAHNGVQNEAFVGKAGGTLIWSVSSCACAEPGEAVGGILGKEAGSSYLPRWHFLLDKERVRLQRTDPCNPDSLSREEGRPRGG